MHELYELKEKLCDELKDYGTKEVTASNLEVIDKLAHATKNIDKIIEAYEGDGYSGRMYPDGMGGSYRGYSRDGRGYSMARGRMNAPRDSRGRYSGADGDMEAIKQEVRRLADKVEQM